MKAQSRLIQWSLWTLIALILCGYALYEISRLHKFQLMGDLVYRVDTQEKVVALTFDDGPKPGSTQSILEVLEQYGVLATFYLNGAPMTQNPIETKLIIDAGHEVGNHGFSHNKMVMMPYQEIADEIESTTRVIRDAGYKGDITFRPPYGKSLIMLPYYLDKNNITTVTWDVESETFVDEYDTQENIVKRTLEQVKPGSIILMHVMYGDGESLNAVPTIIRRLREQGYSFVTVNQLISLRNIDK